MSISSGGLGDFSLGASGLGAQSYSGTYTADAASDAFTWTGPALGNGAQIVFADSGSLPGGITAGTTYYVTSWDATAGTFQVSTTPGGTAVDLTTSGSGSATAGAPSATLVDALLVAQANWNLAGTQLDGTIHRKRLDSGTWEVVHTFSNDNIAGGFVVAENTPSVIVAPGRVSSYEVVYSTNGGSTWQVGGTVAFLSSGAIPLLIAVHPDGSKIYAMSATGSQGVYESSNWGASWTKIADDPAAAIGGSRRNYSIWQYGGNLYFLTHSFVSPTWHWYLGRCALDGSGVTIFGSAALDTMESQSMQLAASLVDDTLVAWVWQNRMSDAMPVVITNASTTPVFTQSAVIDAGLGSGSYLQSLTPLSASLFLAVVENLPDSPPFDGIMTLYRSTTGVSGWTAVQAETDPNGEANGAGADGSTTFMAAQHGSRLYRPLVTPHLWSSTDAGLTWTAEVIPDLPAAGSSGRAFTGLAFVPGTAPPPAARRRRSWAALVG